MRSQVNDITEQQRPGLFDMDDDVYADMQYDVMTYEIDKCSQS